jgi:hypothetical protein
MNWGEDRMRAPKGPLWKTGDPAATWMVHFTAGSRSVNQLGYTANPSDADLADYAKYHHALIITVKRYVGHPVYWEVDRTIALDVSDWL